MKAKGYLKRWVIVVLIFSLFQLCGMQTVYSIVKIKEETTRMSESLLKEEKINISMKSVNSWVENDERYHQIDCTITNNDHYDMKNWQLSMSVKSLKKIKEFWNMNYSINNGKIMISGVYYNSIIPKGQSINFGFIASEFDFSNNINVEILAENWEGNTVKDEVLINNKNDFKDYENNEDNESSNDASSDKDSDSSIGDIGNKEDFQDDWLFADGNKIIDKDGNQVWLTGINWFGYNTGTNTFDGLWNADLNKSIKSIADRGFNILRIPISVELIKDWSMGRYPEANYNRYINSYLNDKNSLEIFDYVVKECRKNGIKIMMDIHSASTDPLGHMSNLWYNDEVSEEDYINALGWIADRYAQDDTILAYDLKNEPHGGVGSNEKAIWNNSNELNNWKHSAEKAALNVLKYNPNVLIVIEGIEIYPKNINNNGDFSSTNPDDYYYSWWGGNLRGVKDYPVDLGRYQNKVIYSPHDYGPSVNSQPWFKDNYNYDSIYNDYWKDSWMFIHENQIAPLLIGEWGGKMTADNLKWMTYLRKLIKDNRLSHTFWGFNANSGDTEGLVGSDFSTWNEEKYNFVKDVLWQENGKFVGLDHKIPLGINGVTILEADNPND